jgi:hypothetical protein
MCQAPLPILKRAPIWRLSTASSSGKVIIEFLAPPKPTFVSLHYFPPLRWLRPTFMFAKPSLPLRIIFSANHFASLVSLVEYWSSCSIMFAPCQMIYITCLHSPYNAPPNEVYWLSIVSRDQWQVEHDNALCKVLNLLQCCATTAMTKRAIHELIRCRLPGASWRLLCKQNTTPTPTPPTHKKVHLSSDVSRHFLV